MTTKPHVHALLAQGGLKKLSGYIVCMAIHFFFSLQYEYTGQGSPDTHLRHEAQFCHLHSR
jgi:hypothetical protein